MYQFFPQNNLALGTSAPYLYFKAVAGAYTSDSLFDHRLRSPTQTRPCPMPIRRHRAVDERFVNPKTYQLLCPGMDGKYGSAYVGECMAALPGRLRTTTTSTGWTT